MKYSETGATLCFDFEDSVYDLINPSNSQNLKLIARENFDRIYGTLSRKGNLKTGVRINSSKDIEKEKDFISLSGKKINTIWLPKADNPQDILTVKEKLKSYTIIYDEIIPIIETRASLQNLQFILQETKGIFSKIVFGHSDYNLSINSLPFFHQYNCEYWKWVEKIISIISDYGILFINSAFLYLSDTDFFGKMLSHLYQLLGNKFGQVTLTSKQSKICNSFDKEFRGFKRLIDNRSYLRVPEGYAENFIKEFENQNQNRGFTVNKKDNVLLSPQEYTTSKRYLKEKKSKPIEIVFTGGCFPVQYNIPIEDLFHQKLKRLLYNTGIELNLKLIRYERFRDTPEKISGYCNVNKTDLLIFHIRPEPFFRLLKLYYKHNDKEGKIKRALNIPFLKSIKPEEFDVYDIARGLEDYSENSGRKSNPLKADMNYIAGTAIGNLHYAVSQYTKLALNIANYCKANGIKFTVLGPLIRNCSITESRFSNYFRKKIDSFCQINSIRFISGIPSDKDKIVCTDKNGKYATMEYHNFIAEKLFNEINSILG
jgi:hypothetical protein